VIAVVRCVHSKYELYISLEVTKHLSIPSPGRLYNVECKSSHCIKKYLQGLLAGYMLPTAEPGYVEVEMQNNCKSCK